MIQSRPTLRNVDGSPVIFPNDVGWTIYARWVNKPGLGWYFLGYTAPRYGRVLDALREMQARPQSEFAWGGLLFAYPQGGGWWKA